LQTASGLVEWFLSNAGGQVKGFDKAIYTGFTTQALARVIRDVLENHPQIEGVYQVSSEPINKYDLLLLMRQAFGLEMEIEKDSQMQIDRSLDSSCFRAATNFAPPSWPDMIQEMAQDTTPYQVWRNQRVS
jgi:dTDP-4-dehydrorhamnose reductase